LETVQRPGDELGKLRRELATKVAKGAIAMRFRWTAFG
jgi:hypothetical protein